MDEIEAVDDIVICKANYSELFKDFTSDRLEVLKVGPLVREVRVGDVIFASTDGLYSSFKGLDFVVLRERNILAVYEEHDD